MNLIKLFLYNLRENTKLILGFREDVRMEGTGRKNAMAYPQGLAISERVFDNRRRRIFDCMSSFETEKYAEKWAAKNPNIKKHVAEWKVENLEAEKQDKSELPTLDLIVKKHDNTKEPDNYIKELKSIINIEIGGAICTQQQ